MIGEYGLTKNFIKLIDGDDIIDLLKEHDLYNSAFEKENSLKIDKIYKSVLPDISLEKLKKSIHKASSFLIRVKNYFEKKRTTHIDRKETSTIINWVKTDLQPKKKNLLVLEGDKGLGKSVILKDVYQKLTKEGYLVLGIKADNYYASTPRDLENKLFLNNDISFSSIIDTINTNNEKLVVIIDQIDALSQTLSSNREFIQTYNRIINELLDERNIRIIISSRTYDLKYDAELSIYNSNEYKNIKATPLNENEVTKTLQAFSVRSPSKKIIQLLQTPNHLEIFCKLPNKEKINLNTLSSLKDLYDKLWETLVLSKEDLALEKVLHLIADEMYNNQQIVIRKRFVSKYNSEINYLLSNQLLVSDESNIQFFHQTFYDYCFARQFVENGLDIYDYLSKNQQNLEIRSNIKMVFEYLREYNPKRYLKYSKSILKSSRCRFHLKLLIINNLGFFEPSNEEKLLVQKHILKNKLYEDIFINSISSEKWIEYLIENRIIDKYLFVEKSFKNYCYDLYKKQSFFKSKYLESLNAEKVIEKKRESIWVLFRNNINKCPHLIISYLDQSNNFPLKHNFIERLLYNLDHWDDEKMLTYFDKYIPYDAKGKRRDNFWFYQIIPKIFEYHRDYALNKIEYVLKNVFTNKENWHSKRFSHDQEKLFDDIYKLSPDDFFDLIVKIYNDILMNNPSTVSLKETNSLLQGCSLFFDYIGNHSKDAHEFIEEFIVSI
ncbi:NACHT domain-containing protein [Kordia jejudonensis]|uniref:NACHT domain-containing protein n=1 Tax=Kordia jejudonensis TaxID=1348245 RepID=UPI00069BE89B|nr:AAA family ATPase [Kordia jejudonensis]